MRSVPRASACVFCVALLLAPAPADEGEPAPPPPVDEDTIDEDTITRAPESDDPPLPEGTSKDLNEQEDPPVRTPGSPPDVPSGGPPPTGDADCGWMWSFRSDVDRDEHEMTCNFWPDPCYADSDTLVQTVVIAGRGRALDKTMFNSASTSCSSLASGALQVWRTDDLPCASEFTANVQASFRAIGSIDPPASAHAGGSMAVQGGKIDITVTGSVAVTSEGDSPGATVKMRGVEFRISGDSSSRFEQYFSEQQEAKWRSRKEIFLLTGTVFISDWANAWILNGRGEAQSGVTDSSIRLQVEAQCLNPCSNSISVSVQ